MKIRFLLDEGAPLEGEGLWATRVERDVYVLDNVPMYFTGLAVGGSVTARSDGATLWAVGVEGFGGHATVWVQSLARRARSARVALEKLSTELSARGFYCEYDDSIPRLAVDLEESDSSKLLISELSALQDERKIEYLITNDVNWID